LNLKFAGSRESRGCCFESCPGCRRSMDIATAAGSASVAAAIPPLQLPTASLLHESASGNPDPRLAGPRTEFAAAGPAFGLLRKVAGSPGRPSATSFLLSALSGQFLIWKSAARCGTFVGVLVCAFALSQSDRHSTDVARCGIDARRFLRPKPLCRKHLQRPIFPLRLSRCRITIYSHKSPSAAAAYFGGNARRKVLLSNDLQHTHPRQWLFFWPRKPRKNSEGVL